MTRTRIATIIGATVLTASLLLARVHPFGDAGLTAPTAAQPPLLQQSSVPPNVRDILITKCSDCHAAQTHTPIYGHFAPISWLLESHIVEARKSMDLSNWQNYSPDQQQTLIAKIIQQTKSGAMPLPSYRIIHRNVRITPADIQAFTQWAHTSSIATNSAPQITTSNSIQPITQPTHTPPTATVSATQATNEGDPIRGATVFNKRCTGCHSLTTNRDGPLLQGVYGRTSASVAGFTYSTALQNAHITWNDQSLDKWLADPDTFLPGNDMDFPVPNPQERKDLIAYLKQSSK